MDYFILTQNSRAAAPTFLNLRSFDEKEEATDTVVLFVTATKDQPYPDFIQRPKWLISDKLKIIFEKSQPKLRLQGAVLTDQQNDRQEIYWLLKAPAIDCLSEHSEWYKDNTIKRIVLDPKKVQGQTIFCLKGIPKILTNYLIINLEVAESILRRDPWGIRLEKVDVSVLQ